ncbi:anoctamin-7-like isoform X1 [Acetobacter orientalis]|uniref:Anoctamin-7-like isoform X1 n=1 Tax=Acetobacter orientalis TaxID=146474 RepID=A0A2Z5ZIU8_9PROT|nr:anoctamin-7-like isoform X1 [Acetobacter orientalis]
MAVTDVIDRRFITNLTLYSIGQQFHDSSPKNKSLNNKTGRVKPPSLP